MSTPATKKGVDGALDFDGGVAAEAASKIEELLRPLSSVQRREILVSLVSQLPADERRAIAVEANVEASARSIQEALGLGHIKVYSFNRNFAPSGWITWHNNGPVFAWYKKEKANSGRRAVTQRKLKNPIEQTIILRLQEKRLPHEAIWACIEKLRAGNEARESLSDDFRNAGLNDLADQLDREFINKEKEK